MKPIPKNVQQGLQRLYYVVSALLTAVLVVEFGGGPFKYPSVYKDVSLEMALLQAAGIGLASVIGCYVFLKVLQWVYRGFVPKPQ